jgi:hypothetical protein
MARAAVSGGLRARRAWRLGVLADRWAETSTAYTLVFEVTDWPGHLAGQHVDVTSAIARCAGCGRSTVVAELAVYGPDPGLVARCPGCGHALLRLARTPTSVWLDLSGTSTLRLPREPMISGFDDSA